MGYEAKLSLKQAPVLALNAALLQAIKLLPMARQELVDAIQQELTENPMLEEKVATSIVKMLREFFSLAWRTSNPWCSRTWPRTSACTSPPLVASPPTSTWTPSAACSSSRFRKPTTASVGASYRLSVIVDG